MRRVIGLVFFVGFTSLALAEEPAQTGGSGEGLEILKKSVAALKEAKTVSYKAEYSATGWVTKFVPTVTGTAVMGEQSKDKIDRFSCTVTIKANDSEEVKEFSAGSDGDNFFVIDPKTKMCHLDMDPAVLGGQGRNIQRVLLREFSALEPFEDVFKSGTVELVGTTKVGDEECDELKIVPTEGGKRLLAISRKDHLPRRATNLIKNEQGEATTVLTISDLVVNPTFVRSPFELRCPEGYKQTDEFAP